LKRILFVDDQPNILSAHRAAMKKYRGQADAIFANGADAALEFLRDMKIDVVVSDMHMPGKDGPALFGAVKELYPDVVRIMLCPQLETDSILVALPVSHQVLAKPLDGDVLWNAIERIYRLRELLTDSLRKKIGGLKQLPSVPTVYMDMMAAMARPDAAMIEISRIIEQDAAMAAKTLQLVNSLCFGLPRSITSVDQAVAYLGMDLVRDLSLTIHIFSALEPTASRAGFSFTGEQEHSLITAKVARRLVSGRRQAQNAFTASLLHDVGKLVLAVCIPEQFKQVMLACNATSRPSHEIEAEMFGMTHAEVGAYLLGLWGLPHSIVEAVAYHHNPSGALERTFDTPTAVSLANALVEHFTEGKPLTIEEHLASLNAIDKLPRWKAIAQDEIQHAYPKYAQA
jgi:HD-like signal output (HDOD) protein